MWNDQAERIAARRRIMATAGGRIFKGVAPLTLQNSLPYSGNCCSPKEAIPGRADDFGLLMRRSGKSRIQSLGII